MDLLNRVTHGKGLEIMQKVSAGTVHLIISEVEKKNICQLNAHWEAYNRILADMGVVVIIAGIEVAAQVIRSNSGLFRYRIGWFTINNQETLHLSPKELFVFTNRVPFYKQDLGYGVPYYDKFDTTKKQAGRVESGLNVPVNLFLHVPSGEMKIRPIGPTCFYDQPFPLVCWIIRNFSTPGDVVCNCSYPMFAYAALLEGRQFISIIPERKGEFIWEIDVVDFWYEQVKASGIDV